MKKTLLIIGIASTLSLISCVQIPDERKQYDEISSEMSLAIHNIEKSLDTYAEKRSNEDVLLEAILKENREIVANFQEAQVEYNVKKTDENFDKLQAQKRAVKKSDALMLENLINSIDTDIEYMKQLSQDYLILSKQYTKIHNLYSSMNKESGSAEALNYEIKEMQIQLRNSADFTLALIDELIYVNDLSKDLESTFATLKDELMNTEVQLKEALTIDSEFENQITLLKDIAAKLARYAELLEANKLEIVKEFKTSKETIK